MGGRGSSGRRRGGGSADGVIISNQTREIETTYYRSGSAGGSRYKNEVLEAHTDGKGNVTFSYPQDKTFDAPSAKTNKTQTVHYKLKAGAVDGDTFNIDWDKVQSVSGQTFSVRRAAKSAGMKWNGTKKRWERR